MANQTQHRQNMPMEEQSFYVNRNVIPVWGTPPLGPDGESESCPKPPPQPKQPKGVLAQTPGRPHAGGQKGPGGGPQKKAAREEVPRKIRDCEETQNSEGTSKGGRMSRSMGVQPEVQMEQGRTTKQGDFKSVNPPTKPKVNPPGQSASGPGVGMEGPSPKCGKKPVDPGLHWASPNMYKAGFPAKGGDEGMASSKDRTWEQVTVTPLQNFYRGKQVPEVRGSKTNSKGKPGAGLAPEALVNPLMARPEKGGKQGWEWGTTQPYEPLYPQGKKKGQGWAATKGDKEGGDRGNKNCFGLRPNGAVCNLARYIPP